MMPCKIRPTQAYLFDTDLLFLSSVISKLVFCVGSARCSVPLNPTMTGQKSSIQKEGVCLLT